MESIDYKISVRSLVSFTIPEERKWSFSSLQTANEGTKGHTHLQSIFNEDEGIDYLKEVHITHTFELFDISLDVTGRIDGIIKRQNDVTIQEIKTLESPLDEVQMDYSQAHWAQGKCYAYLYSLQNGLSGINIMLSYYHRKTKNHKSFEQRFSFDDLARFFNSLLYPYAQWIKKNKSWQDTRNSSINELTFPYSDYRKGQKLLAVNVYKTIENKHRFLAQAPTGTGKTIGVLFPAIKALGEGLIDKIFYLTAKTITRTVAQNAYILMKDKGLRLKTLTLTAKEKICFCPDNSCDPEECEYAENYAIKSKNAVKELTDETDFFDRQTVEFYAKRHRVCPFELSLDLSLSSDLIICDYNYVFDPRVNLKRFFSEDDGKQYCFLIDEAHNLVDRSREMYSAEIRKSDFLSLRRSIKEKLPDIYKSLTEINNGFIVIKKTVFPDGGDYKSISEPPVDIYPPLNDFLYKAENWLNREEEAEFTEEFLDLFFGILNFIRIYDQYDEHYTTFYRMEESDLIIRLFCLDPSYLLHKKLEMARSSVLFSATLSPMHYYKYILGGQDDDITLILPSPFPPDNLCSFVDSSVSTRYRHRDSSYDKIAGLIKNAVCSKTGNYMVFFPSFKYLNDVLERYTYIDHESHLFIQNTNMNESEREEFLKKFDRFGERNQIGFCVMGGIFGEGIDLTGDKLSGVIIVGVGLPQICPERDLIKNYFNKTGKDGFDFSYTYPGINRVLQAAGRVIRAETDRGFVILIDDRFSTYKYRQMLPNEWKPENIDSSVNGYYLLEASLKRFWG